MIVEKKFINVYGRCIGVDKDRALLAIDDEKIIEITATQDILRKLEKSFNQEVHLYGESEWDIRTKKLISFKATKLLPYYETDPEECIVKKLRKICDKRRN